MDEQGLLMSRADKYEHLKELIQAFSEPSQGTVYHYTSADGISGIIDKHEIWMSNTAFMNDTTELKALEKATGIKDDDFTSDAVKEAWRDRTPNNEMTRSHFYMASFSKKKDSLEQWRAYGNFCIGFDATELAKKRRISLYECLYTEDAIRKWILAKEQIIKGTSLPDEDQRNNAAYNLLYVASMKYKNSHFRIEEEIRLVATSDHKWWYPSSPCMYEDDLPIHFRPHRLYGFPVPYLKFFIERESNNRPQGTKETETQMKERKLNQEAAKPHELLPITEVIVGPMAHQTEAKTACEILLSERGYKQVTVTVSHIPYRGI